jgi:hypothetical protein
MTLDQVMKVWAMDKEEPMIEPVLTRNRQRQWVITLEELWPQGDGEGYNSSSGLDKRVEWCEEEMKKWAGVRRMAWDQWWFDDKGQAEKFITLYYLVWAR